LNTGKLAMKEKDLYTDRTINYFAAYMASDSMIKIFATYMIFDKDLYEIKMDGTYEKRNADVEEVEGLAREIARERNLENVFRSTSGNLNGYDWYIAKLDIDLLIQNLPENLRIGKRKDNVWENDNDWIDKIKIHDEENYKKGYYDGSYYYFINRNAVHPLSEKNWFFSIDLITKNDETYVGLYNASENQWAIPPMREDSSLLILLSTGYDDWIAYGNERGASVFYNIKTREKYEYLFEIVEGNMTYMGYSEDERRNKNIVIERF
jgi:hypothetical protein